MKKRTTGFWVLTGIGALILLILLLGQVMAYIDYEFTVSLELQEPEEKITAMGVALNKGIGASDTIIYLPLLLLGLIGLWMRRAWGVFTMAGAMAITAYWPLVSLFTFFFSRDVPGFTFDSFASYTILLSGFTLYGIWGLWFLYSRRDFLIA